MECIKLRVQRYTAQEWAKGKTVEDDLHNYTTIFIFVA
jgi:hypothetical protein